MSDEHQLCHLEKEIVRLQTKSEADDKALVLAKSATNAIWMAVLAIVLALINLFISFRK